MSDEELRQKKEVLLSIAFSIIHSVVMSDGVKSEKPTRKRIVHRRKRRGVAKRSKRELVLEGRRSGKSQSASEEALRV